NRIYAEAEWLTKVFNVIDTGGIEMTDEPLLTKIRNQAEIAIQEADVIIFLVNARDGITGPDEEVANLLYRSNKPVVLAVNKVDNPEARELLYEFYSLGFGETYPISGSHRIVVGDLLDEVFNHFLYYDCEDKDENTIYFSLIGRPNVGKSSLVNTILNGDRVIVSNIEGTTREAVDTPFIKDDQNFMIIDTAGIRKRGKVYESVE